MKYHFVAKLNTYAILLPILISVCEISWVHFG